jgi:drug/metabolite transporter (DMT)-like permease
MRKTSAIGLALLASALFGASTPAAKWLLGSLGAWQLAGMLYLGSGLGLTTMIVARRLMRRSVEEAPIRLPDAPWLAGAVLFGGFLGPVLLMLGLARTAASTASLLLNLEGLATMTIAWVVFRENVDRRLMLGALAILAGAVLLSWNGGAVGGLQIGALFVAGACVCWGIDNNLTRKISGADPMQIAAAKGLVAGIVNVAIGFGGGGAVPPASTIALAALVGFFGYGVSLICFILALRHLGAARTGAYFSTAPFVGAVLSVGLLDDRLTPWVGLAAALMAVGVWLHLTEQHAHEHAHEALDHEHAHAHDEHHQHDHAPGDPAGEPHTHRHRHRPLLHAHAHYPDLHHRHDHG